MGKERVGVMFRQARVFTVGLFLLGLAIGVGWWQGTFAKDEVPNSPEKIFPASSKCKKCHIRVHEEYEESVVARAPTTTFIATSGEP